LNRLKQADGYQIANNTFSPIGYNELLGYDKQGNLNLLQRNTGTANLDNLTYSYTGNQISSISDSYGSKNQYTIKEYNNLYRSTDFSYDPNGNMTKDLDRKIVTIRYNILNLPDTVQFSNGNQIVNLYSADGRKLGTEYFTQVTDLAIPLTAGKTITQSYIPGTVNQNGKAYVDNKIYNTLNGFWTLSTLARISNTEGYYISYNSTPYSGYHYNRTDHLGNIREVWHAASKTTIQRTQYYPSGLPWATTTADNPSMQPYKYNGKEFDEMNGWDTYDYGARGYYPASGRFMTVDPLCEKHPEISPYVYCAGNPVNLIDPDGRDWYRHDESGATFWQEGNTNSVSYNDQTYRNIGETYSSYKDGIRIDYNQNEVSKVSDVSPRFNVEGGQYIPKTFVTDDGTEVKVTFNYNSPTGGNGDKALSKDAVGLLITGVNEANNSGSNITSVDVSTTTTGKHSSTSAHYVSNGGRAFDIDVVNGVSVRNSNSHDQVDAIQNGMKTNPNLRENYGPNIQEKAGKKFPISGHNNHIHASTRRR